MNKKHTFLFYLLFLFSHNLLAQLTILDENFTSCTGALPAAWQQYSVTGTDSWKCTASGLTDKGVYMNGYSGGGNNANEDWLISPSLDLSNYSSPHLFFWSRTKFGGNPIEILISNNYAGSGNPNAATWNAIPAVLPAVNSDIWYRSENIDLSPYKSQVFYIAYKYTSTVNAAALWRVDDVNVYETALSPDKNFVNAGQCASGSFSAGKTFQFTMTGLSGSLAVNAPAPFRVSKDNINFYPQITYNAAASGIPQTVYTRIAPNTADKVYRDSVTFSYNGAPVKEKVYVLGTSLPDEQTLRVVNWNMRWFGDPAMCNCDTNLARINAGGLLQDLNADVYCIQELVNVHQLSMITNALGPNYQYVVSPYCTGVTNVADPYYATCQKMAYIYNTAKMQNLGTFGLLASTYPADTAAYYCFGSGRFPFIMKAKLLLANGGSDTLIFANLHAKAYGAQEDYNRRLCGAQKMTDSLNALFPDNKVLVAGDYNDFLEGSAVAGNVNSPYKYMLDNGFTGITLPSKYPGESSYVWSTDFLIDNLVCRPNLFNKYVDSSFFIFTEAVKYITDFGNTTSDHYPCMSYYKFSFPTGIADNMQNETHTLFRIQNPSSHELKIFSDNTYSEKVALTVYELSGKIIYNATLGISQGSTLADIPVISRGLYFVEIKSHEKKELHKWIIE